MNKLKVINSSSSGNCYILTCNNEKLILDCGLPIKVIKQGLGFDLQGIQGVLVTHCHKDHSLSVDDFKKIGFEVWRPYIEYAGYSSPRIYHKVFGKFSAKCFPLPHNGTDNFGFLIEVDGQKILYMTDFEYCPYVFAKQKINHMLIEANNMTSLLDKEKVNYEHSVRGHANIDVTCKFLDVNKTNELRTVILCHLSRECSDELLFKKMASNVVGFPVYIANAGAEIELKYDNCPF